MQLNTSGIVQVLIFLPIAALLLQLNLPVTDQQSIFWWAVNDVLGPAAILTIALPSLLAHLLYKADWLSLEEKRSFMAWWFSS